MRAEQPEQAEQQAEGNWSVIMGAYCNGYI